MSVSPETPPYLEAEWNAAVADSGLDPDLLHLLPVPGAPPTSGHRAACYPPRVRLPEDDLLQGERLAEANSDGVRDKHRIAIFEDPKEKDAIVVAIMAGKLRHEIRHAEQRIVCGQTLFELDELLDLVLIWKVGGLARGAVFYQFKPTEMDCNAVSARFLRARHPDAIEAILNSDDGALARSNTGPGPLEHLPAKMVACLFCFREVADDPARSPAGLTFEDRLRHVSQDAAGQWRAMATGNP